MNQVKSLNMYAMSVVVPSDDYDRSEAEAETEQSRELRCKCGSDRRLKHAGRYHLHGRSARGQEQNAQPAECRKSALS